MISAADALALILPCLDPLSVEDLGYQEALGRVCAADVIAPGDLPPAANAAMDGYAVWAQDLTSIPALLRVRGAISAGEEPNGPMGPGEATAVTTGALIPPGCTAVIPAEWTQPAGPGRITIHRGGESGLFIRPRGSDIRMGTAAVPRGRRLRPQEIGLLAALGVTHVKVHTRPRIAVLTTGDELVQPGESATSRQVRDSNGPMLLGLIRQSGCVGHSLGIARDSAAEIASGIERGRNAELIVTCGGVSVGSRDHVREALEILGADIRFWKVNIKPGMPFLFALLDRTAVFCLPGNPASALVTFLEFVKPAIGRLEGEREHYPRRLWAVLSHPLSHSDGKYHFIRGIAEASGGRLVVRATGPQSSHMLTSLTDANCLIHVPEDTQVFHAGDSVEIEFL